MVAAQNALPLRKALLIQRQRAVVFALAFEHVGKRIRHSTLHIFLTTRNCPCPFFFQLLLQPLRHRAHHTAVQHRKSAVQSPHSRENALPVLVARALALFCIHLAQHIVKCLGALRNCLQKPSALCRRKRDAKAAAAAAASEQFNQTPGASEANRVVPRRHHHHHLSHSTNGGNESLLPPFRRLGKSGMLARGKQIQPNDDDATFVGKERFESLDQVQKLVFPRVADKPCRGLNTRIARLLHLGEKG